MKSKLYRLPYVLEPNRPAERPPAPIITLSIEQIANWRAMLHQSGNPAAYSMSVEEVQRECDKAQRLINLRHKRK